jgi:hypothetical protein
MYRVNKKLCQEKNAREQVADDQGHAILIDDFLCNTEKHHRIFFLPRRSMLPTEP